MIALSREQRRGFRKRQADDIRSRADQPLDKCAGEALDRIAARLAAPFAARKISLDLVARQAFEPDPGLDQPSPRRADPVQRKARIHAMAAARQEVEARLRLVEGLAFRQEPQADSQPPYLPRA